MANHFGERIYAGGREGAIRPGFEDLGMTTNLVWILRRKHEIKKSAEKSDLRIITHVKKFGPMRTNKNRLYNNITKEHGKAITEREENGAKQRDVLDKFGVYGIYNMRKSLCLEEREDWIISN